MGDHYMGSTILFSYPSASFTTGLFEEFEELILEDTRV